MKTVDSILLEQRMRTEKLLEMAKSRFKNKNNLSDEDFDLPIMDFILKIYSTCDPSCYGANWSKYLIKLLRWKERQKTHPFKSSNSVFSTKLNSNLGDMALTYPESHWFNGEFTHYDKESREEHITPYESVIKKFFEIKISFLGGKNNLFTMRNLRPYQDLDGYLFTFVDCDDDFKFKFLLISHNDLYHESLLNFCPMNSTKKDNYENKKIVYGTTFKKGSVEEHFLFQYNKLKGTGLDDLIDYIWEENEKMKSQFIEGMGVTSN
jgi:hypothetical protein